MCLLGVMDGVLSIGYATVFAYNFGRVHLGTIDSFAQAIATASVVLLPASCFPAESQCGSLQFGWHWSAAVRRVPRDARLMCAHRSIARMPVAETVEFADSPLMIGQACVTSLATVLIYFTKPPAPPNRRLAAI